MRALTRFSTRAYNMTSLGAMNPENVRPEHIYGDEQSFYQSLKTANHQAMVQHTRARYGWEILGRLRDELTMTAWPQPGKDNHVWLTEEQRPPLLLALLNELQRSMGWEDETHRNICNTLLRFMGFLQNVLGQDVTAFCRSLDATADLAALLIAPYPLTDSGRDPDPRIEVGRIFDDDAYRQGQLPRIIYNLRRNTSNNPSRNNPFVTLYVNWMLERGRAPSIEAHVKQFRIICRGFLKADATQVEWLDELYKVCSKARRNSPPSPQAKRKALVGTDKSLWAKLVHHRDRLTKRTCELRDDMDAEPGNAHRAMLWATAVRDELMIGFLLAFQVRTRNVLEMKIGLDILPDEYQILIYPYRTKAGQPIVRKFPEDGLFSDLMGLFDTYVHQARPIILAGRPESPYLFLTNPKEVDVVDRDGQLRSGRTALAGVVAKVTKKIFADLLPPTLDKLSPHLFRDLFTNFAYSRAGNVALASQALTNTPAVAERHYLSLQQTDDSNIWAFIDQELVLDRQIKVRSGKPRAQVRAEILAILGPDAPPQQIQALLKLYAI